jgi:hypothetical protein
MRRYYATSRGLAQCPTGEGTAQRNLPSEVDFGWQFGQEYELQLQVAGSKLTGLIDGRTVVEATLPDDAALTGGGIGLICEEGRIGCRSVSVRPVVS